LLIGSTNQSKLNAVINRPGRKAQQNKASALRRAAAAAAAAGNKVFIPQRACTGFCDMFNMRSLSPNDDKPEAEGNRQKTQGGGSRNKSNNGG
jgi:hypothetical protein